MPKATLPFGELRPDLALLDNQYAAVADNVFPALNSYKPIPSLVPLTTAALPTGPAVGLFPVRRLDGTWDIYAGTRTRLYKWDWSGWTDVSRVTGGNYNVPATGELWSGVQYGSHLIVVQIGDDPQTIDVETGTNFSQLSVNAPRAHNVQVIGDFVVLGGLQTNRRKIRWSSINDSTAWVIGVGLCDEQEFPDCGIVQGVAGNETVAFVVQDRGIRGMQFLPGDINLIFNFTRLIKDRGCPSEYGFFVVSDTLYFNSEDGFYALAGGSNQLIPIGQDKVNDWFTDNSDTFSRNIIQLIAANKPYVVWAYRKFSGSQLYDGAILYNWVNQRWATGSLNAQVFAMLGTHALDLDTDGSEPGDHWLDSPPAPLPPNQPHSLDSFGYLGGRPLFCGINELGQLCSLTGPNLKATLQTAEAHLIPGRRAFVSEVYPTADSANSSIIVETRERLGDPKVRSLPYATEITGSASVLTSARLHRFEQSIPFGEVWTNAQGVLAEAQPDGEA